MKKIILTKEILEKEYNYLKSYKLIAKKYNISKSAVKYYMDKYQLHRKKNSNYVDENFFSNETQETFYWAGFLAADGCVYKGKKRNSYHINLGLSQKDGNHIIAFKNALKSSATIRNYSSNNFSYSCIQITSEKIFKDLKKFNIVPKKSLIYEFPNWLINHPLVNHFMRGYNDGDGCFCILSKNNNTNHEQIRFSLRGTKNFLEVYRDILVKNCDNLRTNKIYFNKIGTLQYGGNLVCNIIGKFLYKNANIYLQRKWDIWNKTNEIK